MPPVTQLDTPPSSPKSPPRKRPKFSLKLKRPTNPENKESAKELYPIFSSRPQEKYGADSCSTAEPLCLPLPHAGLINHGNICYANAVLQVLRHCPGFSNSVASASRRSDQPVHVSSCVGIATDGAEGSLVSLVSNLDKLLCCMKMAESDYCRTKENCEHLVHQRDKSVLVADPLHFMDCFREVNPMFQGHLQHDAQEFLCTLLVNIQDAIKHINKTPNAEEDAMNVATSLIKKPAENERHENTKGQTSCITAEETTDQNMQPEKLDFIGKMFQGRLVIQTRCLTCEGVKKRYEDFQDISVPVEKENPKIDPQKIHHYSPAPKADNLANKPTLSRALSQFATVECLYGDNKYFCESCCTHNEAQITTHFDVLPEVFTVHFKRFKANSYLGFASGWVTKITSNLETPVKLSLKQWCSQTSCVRDSTYELFGMVMHSGIASCSGHYQAYVKVTGCASSDECPDESQRNYVAATAGTTHVNNLNEEESCAAESPKDDNLNKAMIPDGQSADESNCNEQTSSLQSPVSSVEQSPARSVENPRSKITKYFQKIAKNPSKSTKEDDSSSKPYTGYDSGGEHNNNTENEAEVNRDSVKNIQSLENQAQSTKPTNRRLEYGDKRGSASVDATENGSRGTAKSEETASDRIGDNEISPTLGDGDKLNGRLSGWFHFDDADVYTLQDSDMTSVLSSADSSFTSPYLLFYKRVTSL